MTQPHEAVRNGANLLDEKVPGWANEINLEELDLETSSSCILGQVARSELNPIAYAFHDSNALGHWLAGLRPDQHFYWGIDGEPLGFYAQPWSAESEEVVRLWGEAVRERVAA